MNDTRNKALKVLQSLMILAFLMSFGFSAAARMSDGGGYECPGSCKTDTFNCCTKDGVTHEGDFR